jgi:hypothetical protein
MIEPMMNNITYVTGMSSTGVLQYIQYRSNMLHVTPFNQNYCGVYCITAFIWYRDDTSLFVMSPYV